MNMDATSRLTCSRDRLKWSGEQDYANVKDYVCQINQGSFFCGRGFGVPIMAPIGLSGTRQIHTLWMTEFIRIRIAVDVFHTFSEE